MAKYKPFQHPRWNQPPVVEVLWHEPVSESEAAQKFESLFVFGICI